MADFLRALRSGRVLLMDGAMGTELQRAGIGAGERYELWNLTHPDNVRVIHQAYVDAGAEVLLTNTFQANPARLLQFGLLDKRVVLNQAAVQLARTAAQDGRFVLYDVGPFPEGTRRWAAARAVGHARSRQVDGLLMETCSDVADTARVMKTKRRCGIKRTNLHVLLSWTYHRAPGGSIRTARGETPELCAHWGGRLDVVALGINCGRDIGMDEIIEVIRRYRSVTDLPLFARPNAGTPTRAGNRWVYPHTPGKMAARLPELLEAGVSMVGGCCGTTPEHIAAFRTVVADWNAGRGKMGKS